MRKATRNFLLLAFTVLLVSSQSFAQGRQPRDDRQRPGQGRGEQPQPREDRDGRGNPGGHTGHTQPAPIPQLPPYVEPLPQPFPQPIPRDHRTQVSQVITEHVRAVISARQITRIAQLMRLSPQEVRQLEVLSVTVLAQNLRGRADLSVSAFGRMLTASQRVRPHLTQLSLLLPAQTGLEGLELSTTNDISIESISIEVRRSHQGPGRNTQVQPNQLITLQINQQIRGRGELGLKQLAKQQLGLSLDGAEIERIVILGQPHGHRRATVQVEMNNRMVTQAEALTHGRRQPLLIQTNEAVRGNLRLHVNGDALIQEVLIRVGRVNGSNR